MGGQVRSVQIRKARQSDLGAIKALADAYKEELGFVLRPALQKSIDNCEVLVATDGEAILGFVEYHHRRDEQTTLYHIAVVREFQREGMGQALVQALEAEAAQRGKRFVLLKCPVDLPANDFYPKLGYRLIDVANGKQRSLNVWSRNLAQTDISR